MFHTKLPAFFRFGGRSAHRLIRGFIPVIALGIFLFIQLESSQLQAGPLTGLNAFAQSAEGAAGEVAAGTTEAPSDPTEDSSLSSEDLGSEAKPPALTTTIAPAPRAADPIPSLGGDAPLGSLSFYLKALGAFLLVMACLLIFLRLLGRLNRGRLIKDGLTFTLKGTLPLDSRRYIAAVEVDGRLLILGVAPERITSLAHWSVDDAESAKTGLSFGELGLEDSQGDFGLEHGMDNAATPGGTPQTTLKKGRETLKEPAFYRGKTEEEERTMMEPGRDSLGLDESGFSGPETNDDFQRANPDKEGDK